MELKGKKINFLGDSITEGAGTTGQDKCFHQLMKEKYGLSEARNYGIGGTRLAKQVKPSEYPRHDLDFPMRAVEMDRDADIIVVFGGTNDVGHGDAPFGEMSDRTPDTFCGALHYLYRYLMTEYPEANIFICTPLHRLTENQPDMKGKLLSDYVDAIKEAARFYSLPVIDLFANYGVQPSIDAQRERFMPDGLHPNDAGHVLLSERIANFILSY
ncbi:MAG: SGNH/GDSL hydrolase family protein [Clostridia bacterium]|nr:SGNH/GDSL hydrolase family protein [Clostridia bacterium]